MEPDPVPGHPVPGMQIWGWMSPAELTWLGEQAAKMSSVAEIGSLHGRSSYALLKNCPGPVYCIDPWDDEHDLCFDSFMGNCGEFSNLVPVRSRSPEASFAVPTVDMTFIDGAHDLDSIERDIVAWLPKTRKLICGHDYVTTPDAAFPDVAEAVRVFFSESVFVPPETAIWAVDVSGLEWEADVAV